MVVFLLLFFMYLSNVLFLVFSVLLGFLFVVGNVCEYGVSGVEFLGLLFDCVVNLLF